jgi:hypothetical protein
MPEMPEQKARRDIDPGPTAAVLGRAVRARRLQRARTVCG